MNRRAALSLILAAMAVAAGHVPSHAAEPRTLNALFIGNSFTGRHNLADVVKAMAEAGNPGLRFNVTTVIYGGRTLKDHWRLGTQNYVNLAGIKPADVRATIAHLEQTVAKDPRDSFAKTAVTRQQALLVLLERPRPKWDIVVLQSYRDDLAGDASSYAEYAPKFAALIKAQGGRVVLYETTPETQNARALTAAPDPQPILAKAKMIAALAQRVGATVVPMSTVALHCQTVRPDLTLRFVNDGHLNHTMAYLTACTFQAALFDRSPEGLPVTAVTDTRHWETGGRDKQKDRDGGPITRTFSEKERAELQRLAWEGFLKFRQRAGRPD
jgi:hypothetical protein